MRIKYLFATPLLLVTLITGCEVELPSKADLQEELQDEPQEELQEESQITGYAAPLSDEEFSSLDAEDQYRVANKLLGAMYRGVAVPDFFDVSKGMNTLELREGRGFISSTKAALFKSLDEDVKKQQDMLINGDNDTGVEARFNFHQNDLIANKERLLAQIFQYPLSKDLFDHWIAWHLANTILFSPAEEIESAGMNDVKKVYDKLVYDLRSGVTIRQTILRHQLSQENWRRFRSPEDNTREMIEIYLGLFDRDDDVVKASIACKDWYLTSEANNYELQRTGSANTEPQLVLGSYVTSCEDFYRLIAEHPLVISRVAIVLVEYFFAGRSSEDRLQIVKSIIDSNPVTFQEIFSGILFSREYLLNTARPKSFEENFFGTAHRLNWNPPTTLFRGMISNQGGARLNRANIGEMSWSAMSLKLGRLFGIPMDALSFANHHKGYREVLLMNRGRWNKGLWVAPVGERDSEATTEELALYEQTQKRFSIIEAMSINEYIDYLFLTVAMRRAESTEQTALLGIARDADYLENINGKEVIRGRNFDDFAELVFDYISRLPESYYFKKVVIN